MEFPQKYELAKDQIRARSGPGPGQGQVNLECLSTDHFVLGSRRWGGKSLTVPSGLLCSSSGLLSGEQLIPE